MITATNAYYDNELARINELELSEIELTDLRTANELKRQMALSRATTLTNSFTTARVRAEQDALDDIEDLRNEAIDAEMDRQRALDGLRDDALDAERDRADARADLEQDTQDRITDIIRDANRSKEDIERDFQQDIVDQREQYARDQDDILLNQSLSEEERQQRLLDLERENNRTLSDIGRDRLRDLEVAGIREGRRFEDVDIRQQRGRARHFHRSVRTTDWDTTGDRST